MYRVAHRGLLAMALLTVSTLLLPAHARAQSTEQVDSLIALIRELQVMVAEQSLRISALEETVMELEQRALTSASPLNRAPTPAEVGAAAAAGTPGWHSAENWWRIRTGMSYEEVVAILGPPTNIRGGYSLRTLQYQGDVEGLGFIQGEVGIYGDANRVFRIKRPDFGS